MPNHPPQRIKLIFNPRAGRAEGTPNLLERLLVELEKQQFIPEVHVTQPDSELKAVLDEAYKRRIRLFVVCGGDGTIETVAGWMLGKRAVLGIIPGGTQNNVALSLGIPVELGPAVQLLRSGEVKKIDLGLAECEGVDKPFLEVCSIGLISALFDSADQIQKGSLSGVGDFLSTIASFPTASINLTLDRQPTLKLEGSVVLVANLPYFGLNYRLTGQDSINNHKLDVLVFTQFTNLEIVGNILQNSDDKRIQRFRASSVKISTIPGMRTQVDGTLLGTTPVSIRVKSQALSVVTGQPAPHPERFGFLRHLNLLRFFRK